MSKNIPHHYTASTKRKIITLDFIYKQEDKTILFSIGVDSFENISECAEVCKKHNANIDNGELQNELYNEKTGQCFGCNGLKKLTWCGNDFTSGSLNYPIHNSSFDLVKNQICDYVLVDSDFFGFARENGFLIKKLKNQTN